jgi:hypothetical protein
VTLPSQQTINILALDAHQQLVFRVHLISGGSNLNSLEEAKAFGRHLLKCEPQVVRVEVDDRSPDTLSSEEPLAIITPDDLPRTERPAYRDQQPSDPPSGWARTLVRLILGSSFPS